MNDPHRLPIGALSGFDAKRQLRHHARRCASAQRVARIAAGRTRASKPSSAARRDRALKSTRGIGFATGSNGIVIAITISETANVAAATNADHPGPLARTRVSANAASAATASHQAERNHPIVHGWPMKVGASVHNSQRGDQNSSSADAIARVVQQQTVLPDGERDPIPMLIHNSKCCARAAANRSARSETPLRSAA